MVSVLLPTVTCAVRTVAAACWLVAGPLLACEVVAAPAVIPPPMAAAAARLMLAMMIRGCRTFAPCGIDYALSTNTDSRHGGFTRQARYSSGEAAGGGGGRRVWPRLAVGPAGGRDVPGLAAAAPCGRAPGCAGAACASSRWARVRSGISLRIRASTNAAAS